MEHQGGLERRSRTLEEVAEHADDDVAALEFWQQISDSEPLPRRCRTRSLPRPCPAWPQDRDRRPAPRRECPVRSRRAGRDTPMFGIDGENGLLGESDRRLVQVGIGDADTGEVLPPEDQVKFEKPKTKASLLSTIVTSTSSGTSLDSTVASSRPAKPAPSMSTVFIAFRSPGIRRPFAWTGSARAATEVSHPRPRRHMKASSRSRRQREPMRQGRNSRPAKVPASLQSAKSWKKGIGPAP